MNGPFSAWDFMMPDCHLGKKFHLSFRHTLSLRRYFDLARKEFAEQQNREIIGGTLHVSQEQADEFLKRATKIRRAYQQLKPETIIQASPGMIFSSLMSGDYAQLPRTIDDSRAQSRDVYLTNIHFICDFGIISRQAADLFGHYLKETKNLDQYTIPELESAGNKAIAEARPFYAYEIYNLMTAWGLHPTAELPINPEAATKIASTCLRQEKFSRQDIAALFRHESSDATTDRARHALWRAGMSDHAIRMIFDATPV
jgi:hypothetical protein